jgi:hypothetical protein
LFEVAAALWRTHPRTTRTSKAHILLADDETPDEGRDSPKQQTSAVSSLTGYIHNLVFKTISYSFFELETQ